VLFQQAKINLFNELELVPANSSKEEIVNSMKKISPFQSVATYILFPCSLTFVLLGL
jgi:hypothetical protein